VGGEPVAAGFFVFDASDFQADEFFVEVAFDLADGVFLFSSHFGFSCCLIVMILYTPYQYLSRVLKHQFQTTLPAAERFALAAAVCSGRLICISEIMQGKFALHTYAKGGRLQAVVRLRLCHPVKLWTVCGFQKPTN